MIRVGGIMFLYLPDKSQTYWRSESNRKHIHEFKPRMLYGYLKALGHEVYVSGVDHNNSFVVICEKVELRDRFPQHCN